jgi:hypothetical protein
VKSPLKIGVTLPELSNALLQGLDLPIEFRV